MPPAQHHLQLLSRLSHAAKSPFNASPTSRPAVWRPQHLFRVRFGSLLGKCSTRSRWPTPQPSTRLSRATGATRPLSHPTSLLCQNKPASTSPPSTTTLDRHLSRSPLSHSCARRSWTSSSSLPIDAASASPRARLHLHVISPSLPHILERVLCFGTREPSSSSLSNRLSRLCQHILRCSC
ncbi:hypothetical protein K491DRAFT_249463 [Lophiostoma macrostomum CBS 122681]|uniref:Uncharacterized protein n=1 Tax=Lophiostoma macrostomum CBS 122681 TaxID=1314788 RepID=A0A6A6SN32_9PLEO|nr:hypothetical protein K491DRAFT_249463 [Lophiostoma macrostomum CBS 122681]